ncbi:MAG TPA: hypothetical protein VFL59_09200 [Candidatus Nanopelagicales bacterium]|nr:hypothetical protein [Candidatus Nanopelagicales bacterium]
MARREWLDEQVATHPWRVVAVLLVGLSGALVVVRLIDWQASIDGRRPLRRRRSA